ncbi:MAG: vitamin transporter [Acidobacteriota bacterium]|jgi:vitamin B12 transporter|nr:vitamin transporter [Acidobacteriota bacterium]
MITLGLLLLLATADDAVPVVRKEIVVTPERGAAARDQVAAAVTVLTREQIERLPAESLAEIVNTIPGMTMYFDAPGAGAPMITSRGFFGGGEVEYVKLLVDGVPAGDVESGLIDWRHIRVADIERIEVLRGPGSSLYGDASMGGVIQVFTRRGTNGDAQSGDLHLSTGALGSHAADVFVKHDAGALRIALNGLVATSNGYRAHSASRESGGDLTLQRVDDRSRLQFTASLASLDREEPGPLTAAEVSKDRRGSNAAFRLDREKSDRHRYALSYDAFGTLPIRAAVYASDRSTDFPRTLLFAPGFGSTLERHIDTDSVGGLFEVAHEWRNTSLRVGTDMQRASLRAHYDDSHGTLVGSANAHRDQKAFFTTGDWQADERLRISAGLRFDDIRDERAGTEHRSAWSPRLGATFRLSNAGDAAPIVLFAQLAGAFKAPTLDQLFDPRPFPGPGGSSFTISNPSLKPQRARNAEIGVSQSSGRANWMVSAYRMNVVDEIDFDPQTFTYKNIGRSQHTGVEAMAELTHGIVQPTITWAWTRVESGDSPGTQLKNIPEHVAQLLLHSTLPGAVGASIGYRWEHGRFADDAGQYALPDVHSVSAKLERAFGRLRAELEIRNLLDSHDTYLGYTLSDFAGRPTLMEFPAPGRTARIGLTWRF